METTKPKPFVFVLMPFEADFDDIYLLGIKEACEKAGAYCERVDEQIFHESILDRIYNQIAKADIIIADMTGRNPNVFYEVGYAHALDKRVILATQKAEDIPFDLKHYPHIVYESKISRLKDELIKRVRWMIENPQEPSIFTDSNIQFFIDGKVLINHPIIDFLFDSKGPDIIGGFTLSIDAHNSTEKLIDVCTFRLALVTFEKYSLVGPSGQPAIRKFLQPNGSMLYSFPRLYSLLPGSWDKVVFSVSHPNIDIRLGSKIDFTLQMFSKSGVRELPFAIKLLSKNK